MSDTLLDSAYCPIPTPKPEDFRENREAAEREKSSGFANRTRKLLHELRQRIGMEREKTEIQSEAKLRISDLKAKMLPPIVQKHMLAKQEIMDACISNPELDGEVAFVEDPRGNVYAVNLDFTTKFETTNAKQEIRQVRKLATWHVLTFDSVGGKNGYNTEYRVTATLWGRTESWTLLSVRFGKMSNAYYHRYHHLKRWESALQDTRESLRLEVRELTLKILELSREKRRLETAPPAKSKKSPPRKERIAAINAQLPKMLDTLNEKTANTVAIIEQLDKTTKEMAMLPNMPGMKDSGAYIPYSNPRLPDAAGKVSRNQEAQARDIERTGIHSLKESVSRAWTAPDISKYPTNLKWKSGDTLTMSQALPYQVGIVLAIVERMGFLEYASEYNPAKHSGKLKDMSAIRPIMDAQIERALHNLGMNQEGAFDFIRSSVWARGIAQMMPRAHRDFVNQYGAKPDDLLGSKKYESRFIYASTNQAYSLRFMQVHLFDEARYLPVEIRDNWEKLITNPKTRSGLFGLLAAGYNGNISRVKDEVGIPSGPGSMKDVLRTPKPAPKKGSKVKKFFTKLIDPDADNGTEEIFRNLQKMLETEKLIQRLDGNIETSTYVMKFDYVWKYLEKKFPQEFGTSR